MSVIFQSEKCSYISHNKYIQEVYQDLFKLNEDLFKINAPFKKQTLKRKLAGETLETTFREIIQDTEYVSKEYGKFYKVLKSENVFVDDSKKESNDDDSKTRSLNNAKALETSGKLYKESGNDLPMNKIGRNLLNPALVDIGSNNYLFPENCEFYCQNVKDLKTNLSDSKFDLIIMDPPWWNKAVRRKNLKNNHGYKMMSNEELKEIPVGELLGDNGIVVLWCTNSPQHIRACEDFFEKWGVKFVAKWFWLKVCKDGETVINFSEPPSKLPFERIFIARKINDSLNENSTETINQTENSFLMKQTINENLDKCIFTREHLCGKRLEDSNGTILVSIPSALHSHKPPLVEVLQPYLKTSAKCLEIFARYLLPGYTSYGLEVLRFQNACLYEKSLNRK